MKDLTAVWAENTVEPELTETQRSRLNEGLNEIEESLDSDASNLVFHHIFLDDDQEGASVLVYGKPDDRSTLYMVYTSKTDWVSLDAVS